MDSKIGLKKWFICILLMLASKKGQSSLQIKRQLKVSQECCWHMVMRVREMIREDVNGDLFAGTIQADECYLGGKPRKPNIHPRVFGQSRQKVHGRATSKVPVFGIIEEDTGRLRTAVMHRVTADEMAARFEQWVDRKNATLHSDQYKSYIVPGRDFADHKRVDHSKEYVTADGIHTNAIESAWSLLSRAINGCFHRVSKKHLGRYLEEFQGRFNQRKVPMSKQFDTVLKRSIGRRLTERQLVD